MDSLTALLAVYHGTNATDLDAALTSLWDQTHPATEVLVVEDGPVGDDVAAVLRTHGANHPQLRVVSLEVNQGLGPALRAVFSSITTEFVARLDSDDIAAAHRFATQLAVFDHHPELDVVGSAVAEFHHTPGDTPHVRSLPRTHEEIGRYLTINNPINHPSVMMRVSAVLRAGGYRDVHYMEDYDLFARMYAGGSRFYNIEEPLTFFRVSDTQLARRTGREMFAAERVLQRNLVSYGVISRPRSIVNIIIRTAYRLLPHTILRRVYGWLFHSRASRR